MSTDLKTASEAEARAARFKRLRRYAVIVGAILALICKSLPHDYQAPCAALAKICAGGI